ncbi:hypothetical protein ACFLXC_03555 [Chloroflexota bacterium]
MFENRMTVRINSQWHSIALDNSSDKLKIATGVFLITKDSVWACACGVIYGK